MYRLDLPHADAWIEHAFARWFQRCKRCEHRSIFGYFHEVYGPQSWWYECRPCLIITLGDEACKLRGRPLVTGYVWHPNGRVELFHDTDEEEPVTGKAL